MDRIEEKRRRDFTEEVLMLAEFYHLTREDILEVLGMAKPNDEELLNNQKQ